MPAIAPPVIAVTDGDTSALVQKVDHRRDRRWRKDRRHSRRDDRRHSRRDDRRHHGHDHYHQPPRKKRGKDNAGAAVAAGIIGLAAGAILGSTLSKPQQREYIDPPIPAGGYEPWSPAWFRYCRAKYRSFDPDTGYYLAYSGQYRFCN
ncbi:hypothetical protein GR183_01105 [Stappia sp. GBMRC 2046]|uniref:Lectin-like protein BA14k n=2 Tax=Stappia sediminis TaxID=2692190 RepID=A0A7X3LQZ8_9HYPH|nr:hypothetical protein [Stappia sediminis]